MSQCKRQMGITRGQKSLDNNFHGTKGDRSKSYRVSQFSVSGFVGKTGVLRNRLHGVALFGEARGRRAPALFQRVRRRNGFFRAVRLIRPLLLSPPSYFFISRHFPRVIRGARETFRPKKCCVLILCSRSLLVVHTRTRIHTSEASAHVSFVFFHLFASFSRSKRRKFLIL